ncbi:MAG: hypothetical protein AAGG48_11600 [Planctomycetota bacterium]
MLTGAVAGVTRYVMHDSGEESEGEFLASSAQELMQFLETVDGDITVQIAAGTVFELDPFHVDERSIELVAAEGEQPIFRFDDDAHNAAITCVDGRLSVQGIRFESLVSDPDRFGDAPLILCDHGDLSLTHCEITSLYRGCIVLIEAECSVHQTFLSTERHAIEIQPQQGSCVLSIVDCSIESSVAVGVESGGKIGITDSHIRSDVAFETRYLANSMNRLIIEEGANQFDCETADIAVFGIPDLLVDDLDIAQVLPVDWRASTSEPRDLRLRLVSSADEERLVSVRVPVSR